MKTLLSIIILSLLITLSVSVNAQIPNTQYANNISYIAGGIGVEESTAMVAESKNWPLMLEFSQIDKNGWGTWIASVRVTIFDGAKQEVFNTICDGPMLLINLISGPYEIVAVYDSVSQKKSAIIQKNNPQKIAIYWKQ